MTISTHVLDASAGTPAAGVSVTLSRLAGSWLDVESGVTDADGRHRFLADAPAGTYCLTFGTGPYFTARGGSRRSTRRSRSPSRSPSPPTGRGNAGHLHVPLLLVPVRVLHLPGQLRLLAVIARTGPYGPRTLAPARQALR